MNKSHIKLTTFKFCCECQYQKCYIFIFIQASSVSTQTTVSEVDVLPSAPETNCVCPVPSSYISVCQTPNHAPRVIEQSVQPIYSINLPNDQAEILNDFVAKGSLFVRIAGLSGVSAVAMGAYGAHSEYHICDDFSFEIALLNFNIIF